MDGDSRKPLGKGAFDLCAHCPDLCLDRCPVVTATGSTTFSPYGKMLTAYLLDRERMAPSLDAMRALYQCTGCLSCHDGCRHEVDVPAALCEIRSRLVEQGVRPFDQALFEMDQTLLAQALAKTVPERYQVPDAQAVLFPGCAALLKNPSLILDLFASFDALDIRFVAAAPEAALCCGYPLHAAGYRSAFREQATRVVAALRRYKVVVALSPCCAHTLKNLYAAAGVTFTPRVVLALELMAPLIQRMQRAPLELRAAYHDSCFLGRHLGLQDMPRQVLSHILGQPPLELRRNRRDAVCCGAGGAWERVSEEAARRAAANVLAMAKDAGATTLVSGSTNCAAHMASVATDPVEVLDFLTVIARWLGKDGRPPRRKPGRK